MKWLKKITAGYKLMMLMISYFGYLKEINTKLDDLRELGLGCEPFTVREIEVLDDIFDKGEEYVGKIISKI